MTTIMGVTFCAVAPEHPLAEHAARRDPTGADRVDGGGRFGAFGGRYVPETLVPPLDELTAAWGAARRDTSYRDELLRLQRDFIGRPTPLFEVPTEALADGAQTTGDVKAALGCAYGTAQAVMKAARADGTVRLAGTVKRGRQTVKAFRLTPDEMLEKVAANVTEGSELSL